MKFLLMTLQDRKEKTVKRDIETGRQMGEEVAEETVKWKISKYFF